MSVSKNQRRSSSLTQMHPATSRPQDLLETKETVQSPLDSPVAKEEVSKVTEVSEATGQAPESKAAAKPKKDLEDPRERMPGIYTRASEAARIREAFQRNRIDEGYESLSDFFYKAAIKEVRRLEKKYNDGETYEGIGNLKAGRPSKF